MRSPRRRHRCAALGQRRVGGQLRGACLGDGGRVDLRLAGRLQRQAQARHVTRGQFAALDPGGGQRLELSGGSGGGPGVGRTGGGGESDGAGTSGGSEGGGEADQLNATDGSTAGRQAVLRHPTRAGRSTTWCRTSCFRHVMVRGHESLPESSSRRSHPQRLIDHNDGVTATQTRRATRTVFSATEGDCDASDRAGPGVKVTRE